MSSVKKRLLRIHKSLQLVLNLKNPSRLDEGSFIALRRSVKRTMDKTSLDELKSISEEAKVPGEMFKEFAQEWDVVYSWKKWEEDKDEADGDLRVRYLKQGGRKYNYEANAFSSNVRLLNNAFEKVLMHLAVNVFSKSRNDLDNIMRSIAQYFGYMPTNIDVKEVDSSLMLFGGISYEKSKLLFSYFLKKLMSMEPKAYMIPKMVSGKINLKPLWVHECLHVYNAHLIDDITRMGLIKFGLKIGLSENDMDYLARLSRKFDNPTILEGFAHFCATELFSDNIFQKLMHRSFDFTYYIMPQSRRPYLMGYHMMRRIVYPKFGKRGVLFMAATAGYPGKERPKV